MNFFFKCMHIIKRFIKYMEEKIYYIFVKDNSFDLRKASVMRLNKFIKMFARTNICMVKH